MRSHMVIWGLMVLWLSVGAQGAPVQTDAQAAALATYAEVRTAFDDLQTSGARERVPELFARCSEAVDALKMLAEAQSWVALQTQGSEALVLIHEAITENRRIAVSQGIASIEDTLSEVIRHGGDFRQAEEYRRVGQEFDQLLRAYQQLNLDAAEATIPPLRERLWRLVLASQIAEAQDLLDRRRQEVTALETNGAAPSAVSSLRQRLAGVSDRLAQLERDRDAALEATSHAPHGSPGELMHAELTPRAAAITDEINDLGRSIDGRAAPLPEARR